MRRPLGTLSSVLLAAVVAASMPGCMAPEEPCPPVEYSPGDPVWLQPGDNGPFTLSLNVTRSQYEAVFCAPSDGSISITVRGDPAPDVEFWDEDFHLTFSHQETATEDGRRFTADGVGPVVFAFIWSEQPAEYRLHVA